MPNDKTEHFIITYFPDTYASNKLDSIKIVLEETYLKLLKKFNIKEDVKVTINLFDRIDELQALFEVKKKTFIEKNTIYTLVNENIELDIKSIENVLIKTFFGINSSDFILDGLIEYAHLDSDIEYERVKQILDENEKRIIDLLDNAIYHENSKTYESVSYAFTKYLINSYGLSNYLAFYSSAGDLLNQFRIYFGDELYELEIDFIDYLKLKIK